MACSSGAAARAGCTRSRRKQSAARMYGYYSKLCGEKIARRRARGSPRPQGENACTDRRRERPAARASDKRRRGWSGRNTGLADRSRTAAGQDDPPGVPRGRGGKNRCACIALPVRRAYCLKYSAARQPQKMLYSRGRMWYSNHKCLQAAWGYGAWFDAAETSLQRSIDFVEKGRRTDATAAFCKRRADARATTRTNRKIPCNKGK